MVARGELKGQRNLPPKDQITEVCSMILHGHVVARLRLSIGNTSLISSKQKDFYFLLLNFEFLLLNFSSNELRKQKYQSPMRK